ncbi:MAG: (Fe-S)-binding protein [Bacteroidia bacterium]
MQIDLFVPCFVDQLYPETAFNAIKVLEFLGCDVHYNPEQTCCGQPAFNAGHWDEAKLVGEKCIREFNASRPMVVLSSSCTGMFRNYYGKLFHNTALHNQYKQMQKQTFEFAEFIFEHLPYNKLSARFSHSITYHDACSALRECGIREAPRALLGQVQGLTYSPLPNNEMCCGFGGTFAVKYEGISTGMADQKLQHALGTGAEYLVSADLSCLMHLEAFAKEQKLNIRTIHLADVLAAGW